MAAGSSAVPNFSVGLFESKLRDLNSSMQSIQDLSKWLIVNKKHAKTAVGIWFREVQKASSHRKLTLIYLANDVVQNARRKGSEYKTEFVRALPRALHLIAKDKDSSVIRSVSRVISVWEERHVFETEILAKFTSILSTSRRTKSESDVRRPSGGGGEGVVSTFEPTPPPSEKPPNDKEPPTMDVLLKSILAVDGEKSTIQDMVLRQTIANFPSRLYDVDILSKLESKESCEELLKELQEPLEVLSGYTDRMEEELKQRNEIEEMLDSFIWLHQCLLYKAKERRKEYQNKMDQCLHVKETLKSHIASLPDLAAPNSDTLAPLPSVGDLFGLN